MNEPTPKPDHPHFAAWAAIIAAVIGAAATLWVGSQQNAQSGQPTTIINNFGTGIEVITSKVSGIVGQDGFSKRISRKMPLNEATVFDGDVSIAVNAYRPPADVYLSVNGRRSGWRKPGARIEAKKDAANICYVEIISIEEGKPGGGNPSFQIDYFCKALK
nr:hypothetical protein [uncultured Albidiferax sp.]